MKTKSDRIRIAENQRNPHGPGLPSPGDKAVRRKKATLI